VYANLEELQLVADERGFQLRTCVAQEMGIPMDQATRLEQECVRELAPHIDAFWIPARRGFDMPYLPALLEPLIDHNVATWAQSGMEHVKHGALMSIARSDFAPLGDWVADIIAKTFHGISPGEQGQIFELPVAIAINMETARRIGFAPPGAILEVADVVYTTIETESE
jgi:hypothetical protein